ncbi:hypothetical protein LPJ64_004523 [Coemansia asiatica]|uniref:Glucosidase 2 subunit beta n=1 Tax=Coemansia asiatica TaxID=1052880 RepID=A0A9W7XJ04_9FUNG|nr:hypothetical protein LPJ64_004523 [Coemansia asiatica]
MFLRVSLVSLLTAFQVLGTTASSNNQHTIRGLNPANKDKYIANERGNFVCLDGTREIPFSRVNDDYCDCADGSDEPGTSACNNGMFFCANVGHVPAIISSSKVNDGVCDPMCCDGSDEWDTEGIVSCPNVCEQVGKEHRRLALAAQESAARGWALRQRLVEQARGIRESKQGELDEKSARLAEVEKTFKAAEELKDSLEESLKTMKEAVDQGREAKKQAVADLYLPKLNIYRKHLSTELHKLRAHHDSLVLLLRSVRNEHNAEFNDPAVSAAISAYAEYLDLHPYIEDAALEYAEEDANARQERQLAMDMDSDSQDSVSFDVCQPAISIYESERETLLGDIDMMRQILEGLRAGYNKNYHDLAVKAAVVGMDEFEAASEKDLGEIRHAAEAIGLEELVQQVQEGMAKYAELEDENNKSQSIDNDESYVDSAVDDSAGQVKDIEERLAEARSSYWDLQSEKSTLKNTVSNLRELLQKDLGPDDVYLPVDKQCYSLDTGEYTYEVCLLDRATQISNKDGSRQSLGSFTEFGRLADGEVDYSVHRYLQGTKCWNGPNRSLVALFECADEIQVLGVSEPEKCEYHAKMAGPFACPIRSDPEAGIKDQDSLAVGDVPAMADQEQVDSKKHEEAAHDEL